MKANVFDEGRISDRKPRLGREHLAESREHFAHLNGHHNGHRRLLKSLFFDDKQISPPMIEPGIKRVDSRLPAAHRD